MWVQCGGRWGCRSFLVFLLRILLKGFTKGTTTYSKPVTPRAYFPSIALLSGGMWVKFCYWQKPQNEIRRKRQKLVMPVSPLVSVWHWPGGRRGSRRRLTNAESCRLYRARLKQDPHRLQRHALRVSFRNKRYYQQKKKSGYGHERRWLRRPVLRTPYKVFTCGKAVTQKHSS